MRVHAAQATTATRLEKVWLDSQGGAPWQSKLATGAIEPAAPTADSIFAVQVPDNAEPTAPYFTRPSIEQPYYDISNPAWRERSFAPYPLAAWAEFSFEGLPIRLGKVVQTLQRITGPGGIYEPLVVTPAIGVRVEPEARILPLDGSALPVHVIVHAQAAARRHRRFEAACGLEFQSCRSAFPPHERRRYGSRSSFPSPRLAVKEGAYSIKAVAHAGGHEYETGWRAVGYPGLRPYNQYKASTLQTRKVDVKLAPGLRIGYVMGTGDLVPDAIEGMGVTPHLLTDAELASGDFSQWNVIVIGIRAYSVRPELTAAQPRLDEFVRSGGTLHGAIPEFQLPCSLPLSMGRMPERVVDEDAPVKLLVPGNPLLTWPNRISTADSPVGWKSAVTRSSTHGIPVTPR